MRKSAGSIEHRAGLVERTDEVLALGEVDAGLAADRGVDHREQRRRDLHDVDAAVVHRRREARGVADDTAAERDDRIRAQQPPLREATRQLLHGVERLGRLAVGDGEELVVDAGALQRIAARRFADIRTMTSWLTIATFRRSASTDASSSIAPVPTTMS